MPGPPAYFDTSVLLKRYLREAGAALTDRLLDRHDVVSSVIATVEVVAALARRRLGGQVAPVAAAAVLANVRTDQGYWLLLDVGAPVLSRAEDLVQAGRLRTLDALHIGSCLVYQGLVGRPVPFVTADARQRRAAEGANLEVVWVE